MIILRILFAALFCIVLTFPVRAEQKESAYNRIVQTGVIRCGYTIWPPFMERDANTGQFSGMNYDYMMAIAESLGLKVEWASEVPTGQQVEILRSGKVDAICTAEGPLFPITTKYLAYSHPFAYFPFFLYARADDQRFDNAPDRINVSDVRIAMIDGDIFSEIIRTYFPKTTRHAMAQMVSPTQMYMDVVNKKADLFIDGPISVELFLKSNPGTLRQVPLPQPLTVVPNTISVLRGPETADFLDMLNQAIENLRNSGREDQILAPYLTKNPNSLYRVAKPYEVSR